MDWIQPTLLWGLLGLSVPVMIHFWNGRQGRVIHWAATAWLNPQESQSSRSVKLEEKLLLLLRILLWTCLVILLVGLWWKVFAEDTFSETVHLVLPHQELESEFRFELEQAQERGETVLWLADGLPELETGAALPDLDFEPVSIQAYLDQLDSQVDSVHLYVPGLMSDFPDEMYWLPKKPLLHLSEHADFSATASVFQLDSGVYLGKDQNGLLNFIEEKESRTKVIEMPIRYAFEQEGIPEQQDFLAAMDAIHSVYQLDFLESDSSQVALLFTSSSLAIGNGNYQIISKKNYERETGLAWQNLVSEGIVPELILEDILKKFEIDEDETKISEMSLSSKFRQIPEAQLSKVPNTTELWLVLLLLIFGGERFLAYRKNL